MNIIKGRNFILLVIFMATRTEKTTNYKQFFRIAILVCLGLLVRWGYLYVSNVLVRYDAKKLQWELDSKQAKLDSFSDKYWYEKLQYVRDMEQKDESMPRSDHINAIMEIFGDLLDVDKSDTNNITFSDFEISLKNIRLNGHVTNLRILYQWALSEEKNKPGLIDRFQALDFLDNISIKTYEKSDWELWYDFTLTANVTNNGK